MRITVAASMPMMIAFLRRSGAQAGGGHDDDHDDDDDDGIVSGRDQVDYDGVQKGGEESRFEYADLVTERRLFLTDAPYQLTSEKRYRLQNALI